MLEPEGGSIGSGSYLLARVGCSSEDGLFVENIIKPVPIR